MPKLKASKVPKEPSLHERAILSIWVLHEAWLFSIETIERRFQENRITETKMRRLKSKYTTFYKNAKLFKLNTVEDILHLENNARKMMMMLNDLGEDAHKLLKTLF
jgi:hypothetical protein